MTQAVFLTQMARLSGLRFRPADMETHWEALRDLPADIMEAAVTRAQKTRAEFPSPFELRQDADQVAHHVPSELGEPEDRATPLDRPFEIHYPQAGHTIRVQAEWSYYCEVCSDGGWQSVWCGDLKAPSRAPWMELRTCDRRGVHGSHEWVRMCACWDTNPALIRKRENQRKYAEKGVK